MKGWKTTLGSIMAILGAVVGAYNGTMDIGTALTTVGAGIAAIGYGHKMDKNTEAVKGARK